MQVPFCRPNTDCTPHPPVLRQGARAPRGLTHGRQVTLGLGAPVQSLCVTDKEPAASWSLKAFAGPVPPR